MSVAGSGASTGLAARWPLRRFAALGVAVREGALVLAVTREVAAVVVLLVVARGRQRERGLVVAHEIRNVFKEALARFPCIVRRRVAKPAHPVVFLGCPMTARARISSIGAIVRTSLTIYARIVVNQALHDPALLARCIHKRRRTIATVARLLRLGVTTRRPSSRSV